MDTKISTKGLQLIANQKFYDQIEYNKKQKLIETSNLAKQPSAVLAKLGYHFFRKFQDRLEKFENSSEIFLSNRVSRPTTNTSYFVGKAYANLGYSLVSYDLNNDGYDDLIIGAPVYPQKNLYQSGMVYVVYANPKTGTVPLHNLNLDKSADLVINPPADSIRARFGHSISVLDINLDGFNDLVIAAPSYDLRKINYEVLLYARSGSF